MNEVMPKSKGFNLKTQTVKLHPYNYTISVLEQSYNHGRKTVQNISLDVLKSSYPAYFKSKHPLFSTEHLIDQLSIQLNSTQLSEE